MEELWNIENNVVLTLVLRKLYHQGIGFLPDSKLNGVYYQYPIYTQEKGFTPEEWVKLTGEDVPKRIEVGGSSAPVLVNKKNIVAYYVDYGAPNNGPAEYIMDTCHGKADYSQKVVMGKAADSYTVEHNCPWYLRMAAECHFQKVMNIPLNRDEITKHIPS